MVFLLGYYLEICWDENSDGLKEIWWEIKLVLRKIEYLESWKELNLGRLKKLNLVAKLGLKTVAWMVRQLVRQLKLPRDELLVVMKALMKVGKLDNSQVDEMDGY